MPIKVGVVVPMTTTDGEAMLSPWPVIERFAASAADAGLDSLWFSDHILLDMSLAEMLHRAHPVTTRDAAPPPRGKPMGFLEVFSVASVLAERHQGLTMGTLVTSTRFRHPVILAKAAATLHEITGGRFVLGIGAGDSEDESRRFGFPGEKPIGRFEESIRVIRSLLREGTCTFEGEFYTLHDADMRPPTIDGGPKILVGTLSSAPRMNRIVAQYADIWNAHLPIGDSRPEAFAEIERHVLEACESAGRDPATLERSVNIRVMMPGHDQSQGSFRSMPGEHPISGTPEEIADVIRAYERAGVTHLQASLAPRTPDAVLAFGEVVELVRKKEDAP